ncbi:hypothetical protein PRIPAC_86455 [Pristionchus pacificus]|uniref:C-type lectin n=1 Tax=Pristionchus pacificus TaxID=54126 RepID=A0A2A6CCK9_PRIPA|nr:hypothetical protein PRIPAC_86455 [Pristionchus pacificus]|eukprot:PDM75847.1 C-type lectin [Pristionchus pacificus]
MLLQASLLLAFTSAVTGASPTPFVPPSTTPVPLPRECPSGARVFTPTNACYWIVRDQMTWSEAERACVRKGGKLSSVEAEDENEFLYDFTRSANLSSPTFWLGMLNKNKHSGQYVWHDGVQPRNAGAFKNFITREAGTASEMCVSMWSDYTQADGSWHPWSCAFQGYAGVCKRKFRSLNPSDVRSTISPLEDSIQANRCCTHCGKACASNERCIPDDLDCLIKECPGSEGYGWCLPAKDKN